MTIATGQQALAADLLQTLNADGTLKSNIVTSAKLAAALREAVAALCQGRLTLTTGTPVTTSDVTAATTLYFAPYRGNVVGLYDGSAWETFEFTERSLALTGLIVGVVYDIFLYDNAGTLTLESLAWKKVTATNNPAAGSSVAVNLSDTSGLAVGMEVSIKDGASSEIATITAVVASTSITVATLANSYTTPDVYGYPARATALTTQDGVLVKSGATTRRYLGSIRITSTTGQCEDSKSRRYVWNYYNRILRDLVCKDTTDTWTYTTATWRGVNGGSAYGTGRVGVVVGYSEDAVDFTAYHAASNDTAGVKVSTGIGVDATATNSAVFGGAWTQASGQRVALVAQYKAPLGIGAHYLQHLEISQAGTGTTTWAGDEGVAYIQTGMSGNVMA